MASKRKAPGLDAPSSKAEGKRRADAEVEPEEDDLLEAALLLGDGDADGGDDADDLAAAVEGAADGFGEEYEFGTGEDDSEAGDVSEYEGDDVADSVPIDEASLTSSADVSLKGVGLSLAEARRVAQLLASNSSLACIHFEGHDMQISDLSEDGELEWDSEEYTDLEGARRRPARLRPGHSRTRHLCDALTA